MIINSKANVPIIIWNEKKIFFFRIRHTKGKYFYVWPIQCDVCDYVYSTVYVGLLLLILEKNNRICFFLPYIFTHSFIIQSCKSDFLFHPDSSSYLWWIALPELFFCFLYLFVGYVLYIPSPSMYLHNEAILFPWYRQRVWNKMLLYLYLYPSLWYLNPCIVFFVTVGM